MMTFIEHLDQLGRVGTEFTGCQQAQITFKPPYPYVTAQRDIRWFKDPAVLFDELFPWYPIDYIGFRDSVFIRDEFTLITPKVGNIMTVMRFAVMARDAILVQNRLDLTLETETSFGSIPGFYFRRLVT
jgi:hypothetical protein